MTSRIAGLLLVARVAVDAITFTCGAALLHAGLSGRTPLPLFDVFALVLGTGLVLVALLRDTYERGRSAALTVAIVGGAAALGLLAAPREADGLARLGRIVGYGILGEAFLWRSLSIARGLSRWREARDAAGLAAAAIVVSSLVAGVDRAALPPLTLVGISATALALSLARSAEELSLVNTRAAGGSRVSSALGAAFALGVLSLLAALFAPSLRGVAAAAGGVLGPVAGTIAYWIVLPFAYVAAFLIIVLGPLLQGAASLFVRRPVVVQQADPDQERAMLEALDATRPIVFGALEVLIALVAVLVGLVLLARLVTERRSTIASGVTVEREHIDGEGLRRTLGRLLPARAPRRRRPASDRSAAAEIRLLYWRFLELAERAGVGWRADWETPAEHHARVSAADARWDAARPIVAAFERVRYADETPAAESVAEARDALVRLRPS